MHPFAVLADNRLKIHPPPADFNASGAVHWSSGDKWDRWWDRQPGEVPPAVRCPINVGAGDVLRYHGAMLRMRHATLGERPTGLAATICFVNRFSGLR